MSLDNGSTWTAASTTGTNWSLTGQTLTASNTLKVKVTDLAGNDGAVSSQAYVLDTTAPTATISTVAFGTDTGSSSSDFTTSTAAQTISGTLSATLGTGETVYVSLDNGSTWTAASTTGTSWSLAGQTLTASNTLKVKVTDLAGNDGAVLSQAYVFDTTSPTATLTTTAAPSTGNATVRSSELGTAYLVKSTLTQPTTWAALTALETANDTSVNSVSISTANSDTALSLAGLLDGIYSLYTVDVAGNLSSASASTFTVDSIAPTATLTADTAASTGTATVQSTELGTAYLVKSTLTQPTTWAALTALETANDTSVNSVSISTANSNTALSLAGLLDGTYKLYTADAAGNLSAASTNTFTVDSTAPTATLTTGSGANSGNATVSSTELGTAYLVKTGGPGTSVTVSNVASITNADGARWNSVTIDAVNTSKSLSLEGLADGTYTLYTADAAGNLSAASTNKYSVIGGTISLGNGNGQLLGGLQVEGKWYYYWDKDGNGAANDTMTMDALETIMKGSSTGTVVTETNNTFTLNGLTLALPTRGTSNGWGYQPSTAWSSATNGADTATNSNTTYNDYMAIWDYLNGSTVGGATNGSGGTYSGQNATLPSNWTNASNPNFWSSTPGNSGTHGMVNPNVGYYESLNDAGYSGNVLFQVL